MQDAFQRFQIWDQGSSYPKGEHPHLNLMPLPARTRVGFMQIPVNSTRPGGRAHRSEMILPRISVYYGGICFWRIGEFVEASTFRGD